MYPKAVVHTITAYDFVKTALIATIYNSLYTPIGYP